MCAKSNTFSASCLIAASWITFNRAFLLFSLPLAIQVENVRMIDRYNSKNSIVGTLYLTATHLIFVDPEANKETWVSTVQLKAFFFIAVKAVKREENEFFR
jgi:hypothetical protein